MQTAFPLEAFQIFRFHHPLSSYHGLTRLYTKVISTKPSYQVVSICNQSNSRVGIRIFNTEGIGIDSFFGGG